MFAAALHPLQLTMLLTAWKRFMRQYMSDFQEAYAESAPLKDFLEFTACDDVGDQLLADENWFQKFPAAVLLAHCAETFSFINGLHQESSQARDVPNDLEPEPEPDFFEPEPEPLLAAAFELEPEPEPMLDPEPGAIGKLRGKLHEKQLTLDRFREEGFDAVSLKTLQTDVDRLRAQLAAAGGDSTDSQPQSPSVQLASIFGDWEDTSDDSDDEQDPLGADLDFGPVVSRADVMAQAQQLDGQAATEDGLAAPAATAAGPDADEAAVGQVCELLGCSRESATTALAASNQDVEGAINLLLNQGF